MHYDVRNKTTDALIQKSHAMHAKGGANGSAVFAHAVVRHELIRRGVTCICPDDMAGDVYVTAGFVDKMNATTETPSDGAKIVVVNGQELRVGPDETVRLSDDGGLAVVPLAEAEAAEKSMAQAIGKVERELDTLPTGPAQFTTGSGMFGGTIKVNRGPIGYTLSTTTYPVDQPGVGVAKAMQAANPHGSGAMVCVKVTDPDTVKTLSIPGGEPSDSLHVTLAYLGDADEYTPAMREWVIDRVRDAVAGADCLTGVTAGVGRFEPPDADLHPVWAAVDVPGLEHVASKVRGALPITDAPIEDHGWTPHCTIGYLPSDEPTPDMATAGHPLTFDAVHVVFGDDVTEIPLAKVTKAAFGVAKADDVKQYTFSAWYIPDQVDAHGEYTDPEELQQAAWRYVRHNDRRIRLQHNRDVVAGEWLEIVSWPFEITVPRFNPDLLKFEDVTYPAGSVFLGVQWNDWAWELVKAGKIRGLSIGGTAMRVNIDPADEPAEDAA